MWKMFFIFKPIKLGSSPRIRTFVLCPATGNLRITWETRRLFARYYISSHKWCKSFRVCVCEGSRYGKCQPLNYRMNYIAVEKSQQSKEMINSLKGWKTFAANILTRRQNDDDTTEKFKFQFWNAHKLTLVVTWRSDCHCRSVWL